MARFGMLDILDTRNYGSFIIYKYGVQKALDEFQVYLDIHNKRMGELMGRFVAATTEDKRFQFGGFDTVTMQPRERQFGTVAPQAANIAPYDIGVRLDSFQADKQWTERYFLTETVERVNAEMSAFLAADKVRVEKTILTSLYDGTNYSWVDKLEKSEVLPVVALLNADGRSIPQGPTGQTFDGNSHSHYMVITAINDANVKAAYLNLAEHLSDGRVIFEINYQDEAAFRALTDFVPAEDARLLLSIARDVLNAPRLENFSPFDRMIGVLRNTAAEIWVRPYTFPGYFHLYSEGSNLDKPLIGRKDMIESADLQVIEPGKLNPELRGRVIRRTWGCSVIERRNAVVCKVDGDLGDYSAPSGYTVGNLVQ